MKLFADALPKTGNYFQYYCKTNHHMSEAKLQDGVFVCPAIRKPSFDEVFLHKIKEFEREAWITLKCVVNTFVRSNRETECVTAVENMLQSFKFFGCFMGLTINFLN
jgi:hypothetical protein